MEPAMNERIIDDGSERLAGDITFGAFANPRLKAILSHFGKAAFGRASACMEFEHFLQAIGAKGKCCLEIGTFHGITAVILSQYFDTVVSVSVDEEPQKLLKHDIVHFLGIRNIVFHDVKDNAEKKRLVDGLTFDFAYSDGDHTHDARADFDLVKRCGRVLLHEYWPLQPAVWNLVNSLPSDEITRAQFDCLAYWQAKLWTA
jgi:hypothetical protein